MTALFRLDISKTCGTCDNESCAVGEKIVGLSLDRLSASAGDEYISRNWAWKRSTSPGVTYSELCGRYDGDFARWWWSLTHPNRHQAITGVVDVRCLSWRGVFGWYAIRLRTALREYVRIPMVYLVDTGVTWFRNSTLRNNQHNTIIDRSRGNYLQQSELGEVTCTHPTKSKCTYSNDQHSSLSGRCHILINLVVGVQIRARFTTRYGLQGYDYTWN